MTVGSSRSLSRDDGLFKIFCRELTNKRGHTLKRSHYAPSPFPEETPLPCVIYCRGNRADANEAVVILIPSNITISMLDLWGFGLSNGEFVNLGQHEILITDHADTIATQSHVKSVVEQLNCLPSEQHGMDVTRTRQWYFDGYARFYRHQ